MIFIYPADNWLLIYECDGWIAPDTWNVRWPFYVSFVLWRAWSLTLALSFLPSCSAFYVQTFLFILTLMTATTKVHSSPQSLSPSRYCNCINFETATTVFQIRNCPLLCPPLASIEISFAFIVVRWESCLSLYWWGKKISLTPVFVRFKLFLFFFSLSFDSSTSRLLFSYLCRKSEWLSIYTCLLLERKNKIFLFYSVEYKET